MEHHHNDCTCLYPDPGMVDGECVRPKCMQKCAQRERDQMKKDKKFRDRSFQLYCEIESVDEFRCRLDAAAEELRKRSKNWQEGRRVLDEVLQNHFLGREFAFDWLGLQVINRVAELEGVQSPF